MRTTPFFMADCILKMPLFIAFCGLRLLFSGAIMNKY